MRPWRERLSKKWGTSVAGSAADALAAQRQLDTGECRGRRGRPPRGRPPRRAARGRRRTGGCRCARRARGRAPPEHDGDVLDRVVLVHPQVARAVQLEVDQRVRRKRRQHVVEHADPGGDCRPARRRRGRCGSGCPSRACAARSRPFAPAPSCAAGAGAAAPSAASRRSSSAGVATLMRIESRKQRICERAHDQALLEQLARERLRRPAEVDEHEVRARVRHRVARRRAEPAAIRSRSAHVARACARISSRWPSAISASAAACTPIDAGGRTAFSRAASSGGAMM